MSGGYSGVVREALEGAEFYLSVDLDHLRRDREAHPGGWEPTRWDPSGEGEEICGEVLAKVKEALASLDGPCDHEWIDISSEDGVIESGAMCPKCRALASAEVLRS